MTNEKQTTESRKPIFGEAYRERMHVQLDEKLRELAEKPTYQRLLRIHDHTWGTVDNPISDADNRIRLLSDYSWISRTLTKAEYMSTTFEHDIWPFEKELKAAEKELSDARGIETYKDHLRFIDEHTHIDENGDRVGSKLTVLTIKLGNLVGFESEFEKERLIREAEERFEKARNMYQRIVDEQNERITPINPKLSLRKKIGSKLMKLANYIGRSYSEIDEREALEKWFREREKK